MRYLPFIFIVLMASCTTKKEPVVQEKKVVVKYEGNIFNPLYLGKLIETPISMGPILNLETCQSLHLSKITLYVKGGRYHDKYSEKMVYLFNKHSLPTSYFHYLHRMKEYPYSELEFMYNTSNEVSKINVNKYMGFSNLPPVLFSSDSSHTLVLTSKGNDRSDSLLFFPSSSHPKMIASIVNNLVSTLEIVADKGTNSEDWKFIATSLDSSLNNFTLTSKTITLTENGLPIASYDLDSNWNQKERIRSWEYNAESQPVYYKEWLHGSLVKLMEISYASNNLPKLFVIDRKKYHFYSEFHAK